MKSGDEPAQSAAHTKPTVIARNPSEEMECSKCHMYFGIRGAIEAHEKRHADHADDDLYKFQHPKDYTAEVKPVEGKIDQFRKQKGLELALKNEIVEPAAAATTSLAAQTGDLSKQPSAPTPPHQETGTTA